MAKELYFECYSGISGDMTVAALLDLGADRKVLEDGLASLGVDGYRLSFSRANKNGIDAYDFCVELTETEEHPHDHDHGHGEHPHEHPHDHDHGEHPHEHPHDHDHDHGEHPHEHPHDHDHDHGEHPHEHPHDHDHGHGEHPHEHPHIHDHSHGVQPHGVGESAHIHAHPHVHRGLPEILAIIDSGAITEGAKAIAKKIFYVVAEAEAKVHGKPIDEVHFHEVGAVDSIVDIVGAAICLDNLGIEKVYASPLYEGTGYVRCQHGLMPVPAPATAQICANYHIPLKITANKGEMVTPTGAAIIAALADQFSLPDVFVPEKIGVGAGKKDFVCANVLRVYLLQERQR